MKIKAPSNFGTVVDADGNIVYAWGWRSTPECPLMIDVPDGGEVVSLAEGEHERVHKELHLHKYDRAEKKIKVRGPHEPFPQRGKK